MTTNSGLQGRSSQHEKVDTNIILNTVVEMRFTIPGNHAFSEIKIINVLSVG